LRIRPELFYRKEQGADGSAKFWMREHEDEEDFRW